MQGTSYINSEHKEVWINHFMLNIGFVRRGMYIVWVKLKYLAHPSTQKLSLLKQDSQIILVCRETCRHDVLRCYPHKNSKIQSFAM